ncbi:MAG: HAD family hydrolase [Candidatus Omnitrophota bacterium]
MKKMKITGIKLIIFDLDGTLIDAYDSIERSFNFTMLKLGYQAKKHLIIRRAVGWGDKNLLKPFVSRQDLNKALLLYRKHHKTALIEYSRVYKYVYLLLNRLRKKGYKLAVASNRPTRFSWILLRHLRLEKYFDYVLCADKLEKGKPNPQILIKIMEKFKAGRQEAVYVGDMALDAEAGRRAGIKTIIVTTGSSTKNQILKEKPYLIIKSIKEIPVMS